MTVQVRRDKKKAHRPANLKQMTRGERKVARWQELDNSSANSLNSFRRRAKKRFRVISTTLLAELPASSCQCVASGLEDDDSTRPGDAGAENEPPLSEESPPV